MDALDLLQYVPKNELLELAERWNVPCGHTDPEERARQLLADTYTEANIKRRIAELTGEERACLELLAVLSSSNPDGLTSQDAMRKINELLGARGRGEEMISRLRGAGLLFQYRHYWNLNVIAPKEVWQPVLRDAARNIGIAINQRSAALGKVQVTENYGLALYHDVMTLLSFIANETVEVSQKGHVYKRTINRILPLLRSNEFRFPTMFGVDVPMHFAFMERFAGQLGLADFREVARVQPDALHSLLAVPYTEWAVQLQDVFMPLILYGTDLRYLPSSLIYNIFYSLVSEEWIDERVVLEELSDKLAAWKLPVTEKQLNMLVYNPLLVLGLIERGQDAEGNYAWRWTAWGSLYAKRGLRDDRYVEDMERLMTDHIYVQPNMDIIVPENVAPAIRWQIEAIAELKQADTAYVYTLHAKRIIHALECGWTFESIRALLERHSKIPVAPNVWRTIEDWIGHFGKARLMDVMVLYVDDPPLAERVRSDKKLDKWIVGSFSPQSFLIRRNDERQVRELMQGLGLPLPARVSKVDNERDNGRVKKQSMSREQWLEYVAESNMAAFDPEPFRSGFALAEISRNGSTLRNHSPIE